MTEKELINMGFKKKKSDSDYWFVLKMRKHVFITNDTLCNNKKDKWIIGYQTNGMEDMFWFNNNLKDAGAFKIIFHVLTGVDFKLAHQRNLIR